MDTSVSRTESCIPKEAKQQALRTLEFSQLCDTYVFPPCLDAPNNSVVCLRVLDNGAYTSGTRTLYVTEVLNTGELVPWNGPEKHIDFAARCNEPWEATLVVVAVDVSGSEPKVETKTTRVKLKGTIFVGDPDE